MYVAGPMLNRSLGQMVKGRDMQSAFFSRFSNVQ